MKQTLTFFISLTMIFTFCLNVLAVDEATPSIETSIEYFEDGSYIITTITEEKTSYATFTTKTKSGSKKITYKNTDGEVMWTATLTANFTYTGSSSSCTSSSIVYNVSDSTWKITSATTSNSGNKATGNVIAKHYFVGIPIKTIEATTTLACSANGTLS